jgi:RIO kinase 1
VQLIGTELMLEFIGDWETGEAAPRLAQVRADRDTLEDLWPQMVDALANPQGADFIARDVRNVATWFTARGVTVDPDVLLERLLYEAGLR